jgi:zinc transporter ZupT
MTINLTIIASTIIACLAVSLCALSILFALWIKPDTLKSVVPYLVALAVGVMGLPGAIFTLLLSQVAESSLIVLLPIAAGGFIYIAGSDLIPVLHERSSITHLGGQSISFATGIGLMQFIVILEQALMAA